MLYNHALEHTVENIKNTTGIEMDVLSQVLQSLLRLKILHIRRSEGKTDKNSDQDSDTFTPDLCVALSTDFTK